VLIRHHGKYPKGDTPEGYLVQTMLRHLDGELNLISMPCPGVLADQPAQYMDTLFQLRGAILEYRADRMAKR